MKSINRKLTDTKRLLLLSCIPCFMHFMLYTVCKTLRLSVFNKELFDLMTVNYKEQQVKTTSLTCTQALAEWRVKEEEQEEEKQEQQEKQEEQQQQEQ